METVAVILILLLAVVVSGFVVRLSPVPLPLPLVQTGLGALLAYAFARAAVLSPTDPIAVSSVAARVTLRRDHGSAGRITAYTFHQTRNKAGEPGLLLTITRFSPEPHAG